MANIVIKKKVGLDFLGKEYESSYLTFQSMSIAEYEKLLSKLEGLDNIESVKVTVDILKSHFVEGKFQEQEVSAEDLEKFDIQTLITCLEYFTGQKIDPKV